MVSRVCRDLGGKQQIIVLNDEAHHCYRRTGRTQAQDEKLTGEEQRRRRSAKSGPRLDHRPEAVKAKIGIKPSTTCPRRRSSSAAPATTRAPFPVGRLRLLTDRRDRVRASSKVPRSRSTTTRRRRPADLSCNLWAESATTCRRRAASEGAVATDQLPAELEGALHSLYGNYEKAFTPGRRTPRRSATASTPPVFIVVCNNTNVSKLVYD